MKEKVLFILALAFVIPALFGNFWFIAATSYLVEATTEPLLDKLLDSIAPD